jgi:hypothetical protein
MADLGTALSSLGNIGSFVEIQQTHGHQREQVAWMRRAYILDTQAMRMNLLTAAKEEIRAHYDTYAERLNTWLTVDALFWPFGLASLQFSSEFIPQTEAEHQANIEAVNPGLIYLWVYLVGGMLVMPFWSILMLVRCKLKLDFWLEESMHSLTSERRDSLTAVKTQWVQRRTSAANLDALALPEAPQRRSTIERLSKLVKQNLPLGNDVDDGDDASLGDVQEDMEQVVARLGGFILDYQEHFSHVWNVECGRLIYLATSLLWMSAVVAVILNGMMFWMYLCNRDDSSTGAAQQQFFGIVIAGLVVPVLYVAYHEQTKKQRILNQMWDAMNPFRPEQTGALNVQQHGLF